MSRGGEKYCRLCQQARKLHKITIIWSADAVETAIIAAMNTVPHLLIVDDDKETCALLSKFLVRHGYRVSVAHDSRTMSQVMDSARINLMILDLMLPGEDGLAICRRLRAASTLPIIMLTAMGEEMDRIVGLEMGADDYLPKAANPRELLARIRAVLRRAGEPDHGRSGDKRRVLEFNGWRLDVTQRQLYSPANAMVPLRASEFELLLALAERPQRVLTRDQLLDLSRGRASTSFDRSIDVLISRLRRKMEDDPKEPSLIRTVRSGGYVFSAAVTSIGIGQ
jgi:two-component system, OmpR family, response regulator